MASVLFTTVGQAVGGPLGAAVGAAVGSTLDSALLDRGNGGGALLVQRSSYGDPLPRLFGRTRTSGVVIWALPMRDGAGKGDGRRGHATSFAVALSSGPIRSVGRIWADGREFRNAEGVFETATMMRVHDGSGAGEADPLIAAAEGVGRTPAYRGLAYVVFEDMALAPFGNRIPALSFEVDADDADAAGWLRTLAGGLAEVEPGHAAVGEGFVAATERLTPDVELLVQAAGLEMAYRAGAPQFAPAGEPILIPTDALAGAADSRASRNMRLGARPGSLAVGYRDPARDYQAGRQQVTRGKGGASLARIAPLTATATAARGLAERWLRKEEAGAELLTLELAWAWFHVDVGTVISLEGRPETWRVIRRDVKGLMLRLTAALLPEDMEGVVSDSGRVLSAPLVPAPSTRLTLLEPPVPLRPGPPALWVVGGGAAGWRGAEIRQLEAGLETALGRAGPGVAWGRLLEPLPAGPGGIWDEQSVVWLAPEPGVPVFETRSALEVLSGANLAIVGEELIQFREAAPQADGSLLLRGLLRARFGTASVAHPAGAEFWQVRPELAVAAPYDVDSIGRTINVLALGAGDPPGGTLASRAIDGRGAGPMAPVHLRVKRGVDGSVRSSWVPRGRDAMEWSSAEPADTGFVWRFVAATGEAVNWPVSGSEIMLSVEAQTVAWGGALPAGEIVVEALGEGPLAARRTVPVVLPSAG